MIDTFIEAPALAVVVLFLCVMPVVVYADARGLMRDLDDTDYD